MEKEESILKQNFKICLPVYKIAYSVVFLILLSLVRGIMDVSEIGITIDSNIALLAIIFCSDTYEREWREKRWEVFFLLPQKSKTKTVRQRLMIQIIYLCILAYIGYGFFYWQKPQSLFKVSPMLLYVMFIIAVTVSISFWAVFSMMLVNISHHLWFGIGISLIVWLFTNSKAGEKILGDLNIFAFTFRNIENLGDWYWLLGKFLALIITGIMIAMIPYVFNREKRRSI